MLHAESIRCTCLPALVTAGWSQQLDAIVTSAGHQQLGVQVARIDDVRCRQQSLAVQGRVDDRRDTPVSRGGGSRFNVRNEVGSVRLAVG